MAWGERAAWLQRIHEKEGGPLPKALADKPSIPPELGLYWRAFDDLRGDRMNDLGGLGAIWWSSIAAYADRIGIVGIDAFERFADIIKAMDGAYRDYAAKQAKQTTKK